MGNSGRICLKDGQKIQLCEKRDGKDLVTFRILRTVGRGSSAICYEAIRESDGKIGKLKEYYPVDTTVSGFTNYYSMKRLDDGQLVPGKGTERRFDRLCDDYLHAYKLLNQVIAENREGAVLKNFVQNSEIYYGCLPKGTTEGFFSRLMKSSAQSQETYSRATVYIWAGWAEGQNFDDYIKEIRANPQKDADFRLHDILEAIIALTDGVRSLHTAGLLHLDIKPSNFMVAYDSSMNLNASNVSLFDVDTIYSVSSELPDSAGSKGYRAPEIKLGEADNRSDIYSIGAVLFNAIVINDDIPDGLYDDSYYDDIDQLLRHSKLIKGSESHSDIYLMKRLADILKKCLTPDLNVRYECASDLLEDLNNAELYSSQYAVGADQLGTHKRLRVIDTERKGTADPSIVVQKMLYNHPLFECLHDSRDINVLVIGCGLYSQKFIDIAMQSAQMKDYQLSITAVSSNIKDEKDLYLRFRPDLQKFVDIDHAEKKPEQIYASLNFLSLAEAAKGYRGNRLEFKKGKTEAAAYDNQEIVRWIITNQLKRKKQYHYIFVSLGDEELNRKVSKYLSEMMAEKNNGYRCPVVYVSETTRKESWQAKRFKVYRLCINEVITPDSISPQLEQMAFNTHSVWNHAKKGDISEQLNQFRNSRLDYSSSLAFALSIKYKLYSIGIQTADPQAAARQFYDEVLSVRKTNPEAAAKFNALTALEHRRWILYMACDGWTAPRRADGSLDLSECVKIGKARNELKHTHACMAFSTEETPLQSEEYTKNHKAKWDSDEEDPSLDELDRMSVELHQLFAEEALNLKKRDPLHNDDIKSILSLLSEKDENLIRAYEHFVFCLKNILNGSAAYSSQYRQYENNFLNALSESKEISETVKTLINDRLSLVRKAFVPAIEASFYRDYKAIDSELISQIPYILTRKAKVSMAVGFVDSGETDGRNEDSFTNVASATVISPQRIRYYYLCTKKSRHDLMVHKLKGAINYLNGREMNCSVSIVVLTDKNFNPKRREAMRRMLTGLIEETHQNQYSWLSSIDLFEYKTFEDASVMMVDDMLKEQIDLYDGSAPVFNSAHRDGKHIERVMKADIGYFEFNHAGKSFRICHNCGYLKYLKDDSYLRISDMFALMNVTKYTSSHPEFAEDYEKLWDIYTGCYLESHPFDNGVSNWNQLSHLLSEYKKRLPVIVKFPLRNMREENSTEKSYFFPSFGFAAISKIVAYLKEYKVIAKSSEVVIHTTDECKATIITDDEIHKLFENLTLRSYLLHPYYDPDPYIDNEAALKWLVVRNKDLRVRDLNLDPGNKQQNSRLLPLLKKLNEENFITDLKQSEENPDIVSFVYSSPRIRKLLTKAGEILEIYTYFEVMKLGYFDDISTGFRFEWEEGGVNNELDIVLTKGFHSIIAECKAVRELSMDYYHKLYSIANQFGIGNNCLLIGNTYRVIDHQLKEINDMHRSRGSQLSIATISDEENIVNIAEHLKYIMEKQISDNNSEESN